MFMPEITEEKKPIKSMNLRSQFSMGMQDFERYTKLLGMADEYGVQLWNGDISAITPYFSALKQFYIQIRLLIRDKVKMDDLKKSIENQINYIENDMKRGTRAEHLLPRLRKDMEAFATRLYELKNLIGMGIEIEKPLSTKKKWERAGKISSG